MKKRIVTVLMLFLFFFWQHPSAESRNGCAYASPRAQQLFKTQDRWVEEQLREMTLSEKIGQMLVAHSPAKLRDINNDYYQKLSLLVSEGKVGGIMFLKGNRDDAAVLCNRFQLLAPRPLLISADMEKGLAMRIDGTTEFAPSMALSATGDPELAYRMAAVIADEAKALGIHHSYGPSLDLNVNPQNPIINTRSYGDNIALAVKMSKAFIDGLQSKGMIATAKHFPGHGDVTVDSHVGLPVLQASYQRLENLELQPFKAAIDYGIMSVMIGHLAVPKITGTMAPATLSWRIVTQLLRKELGFEGLIITDALNMKALYQDYTLEDISVLAVEAGNDLLLFSPDPELSHRVILEAVEKGRLTEAHIDSSVRRILLVKRWLGLDKKRLVNINAIPHQVSLERHRQLAATIADHAITVVRDRYGALPVRTGQSNILHIILDNKRRSVAGGSFARKMGLAFNAETVRLGLRSSTDDYTAAIEKTKQASTVILSSYVEVLSGAKSLELSGKQQRFIENLMDDSALQRSLIMISFGTPYLINQFPDLPNYICTYSSSEASEDAALKLLKGELTPAGKLPVSLVANIQ